MGGGGECDCYERSCGGIKCVYAETYSRDEGLEVYLGNDSDFRIRVTVYTDNVAVYSASILKDYTDEIHIDCNFDCSIYILVEAPETGEKKKIYIRPGRAY